MKKTCFIILIALLLFCGACTYKRGAPAPFSQGPGESVAPPPVPSPIDPDVAPTPPQPEQSAPSPTPTPPTSLPIPASPSPPVMPPPPPPNQKHLSYLTPAKLYGVYYGSWTEDLIRSVTGRTGQRKYDLIILHPKSNITRPQIATLQEAGIKIFCYLSVGEDDVLHNASFSAGSGGSYASWYLDLNRDGFPDSNDEWNSYYVDPSNPDWQRALKTFANQGGQGWYGYDYLMNTLGCDGLFLDTVDPNILRVSVQAERMIQLIAGIRQNISPDKAIIINRGLVFFDTHEPGVTEIFRDRLRSLVDGVMFEDFYKEENRAYWAELITAESRKPDGFAVLSLDYVNLRNAPLNQVQDICNESRRYGWLYYVSSTSLTKFANLVRDECL